MKDLSNLAPAPGSNHAPKRLGRGIGSGLGKTAGKGHKGQKARSGGTVRVGFEGGQTPMHKRIPKFGFSNDHRKIQYTIVSLSDLNTASEGQLVDSAWLLKAGLIRNLDAVVKVLNNGKLEKKLSLKVAKISAAAKEQVVKLGGSVEEN